MKKEAPKWATWLVFALLFVVLPCGVCSVMDNEPSKPAAPLTVNPKLYRECYDYLYTDLVDRGYDSSAAELSADRVCKEKIHSGEYK